MVTTIRLEAVSGMLELCPLLRPREAALSLNCSLCERILKAAESYITLDRARFLAEKIYQIDYVNPYNNKQMSVLLHTKEEPEVTELLNIISANC